MSLEDEPTARPPSPGPGDGEGNPAGDPPPALDDDLTLPAPGPPRNATSRADKRRNQRR